MCCDNVGLAASFGNGLGVQFEHATCIPPYKQKKALRQSAVWTGSFMYPQQAVLLVAENSAKLNIIQDGYIIWCWVSAVYCYIYWGFFKIYLYIKEQLWCLLQNIFKFSILRNDEKPEKCDGSFNSNKSLVSFLWIFYHFKVLILHLSHIFCLFLQKHK